MKYEEIAKAIVQKIYAEGLHDEWITACRANPRPAIPWAVPEAQRKAAKAIFRRAHQLCPRDFTTQTHVLSRVRTFLGMQGA